MRHKLVPIVALALLIAVVLPAAAPAVERPEFVPGQLIIKFKPGVDEAAREALLGTHALIVQRVLRGTEALLVQLPAGADVRREAAALASRGELLYAEPNYYRYLDAVPNDPRFGEMYNLNNTGQTGGVPDADIDAPEAWDIAIGSPNVVVASLDSGLEMTHQDIAANVYTNPGEIPGNHIDDDGNGYIDDVHGWDFRNNDNDPSPSGQGCVGHGTHTAGTVGAVGNNGVGVSGVAQRVKIMPLRAFYPFLFILCTAQDADLIEAINYMTIMKVPVSNNSWGGSAFSQATYDAIRRSRQLFVAAAGNDGANTDNNPSYPASYDLDHIVSVASTDDTDHLSGFSNYGVKTVDLAAPGSHILSTLLNNSYGYLDGTSMASPHVAGAAAVLLSQDPTATPAELKNRLLRGVDVKGLPVLTGGRLNLNRSLLVPPSDVTVDVEPVGGTDLPPGGSFQYTISLVNNTGAARQVEVSVRFWVPTGAQVYVVAPLQLSIPPGGPFTKTLSGTLPPQAPAGEYWLIGRVQDTTSVFDEDKVVYNVN